MSRLDRYLARELAQGWILVWLVLTTIFGLLAFVDELERVSTRYPVSEAVRFILYTLPQRSMDLAPVIALLGALIALAKMNKNSEIIAMRAAGISLARFTLSVAMPALMLMGTLYAVSEFVAAPLYQQAEARKTVIRSGRANLLKGKGLWSHSGNNFFNVRSLKHGQVPTGIYLYGFSPDGRLTHFIYADHAQLTRSRRWKLVDVEQKSLSNGKLVSGHLDQLEMGPFWSREELPILPLSTTGMTPTGLYEYADYLRSTNQLSQRIERLFWQKMALPLTAGTMVLLALPIGASLGTRRSGSFGRQLAIGAGTGIGFYLLSQLIRSAGALADAPPALVAFLPAILVLGVTAALIHRMR